MDDAGAEAGDGYGLEGYETMGMEVRRPDGSVIMVEIAGEEAGRPVLFCHGLADSRLAAQPFGPAARELGLRLIAPDRPGIGGTDRRALGRLADWVDDAMLVLDALVQGPAGLMGVSGGGPFAAACAARLPGRVRSLTLVCPLGSPGWPTRGMSPGQRLVLPAARHAPAFGGWFLGRLAALGRRSPGLFHRVTTSGLPGVDRCALERPGGSEAFLAGWTEAFRQGTWGVAQDLRMLMRPWGFELGSITVPTSIHHGDADTTVPPQHARLLAGVIPDAQLRLYPGHGHFSILDVAEDMLATLTV